MPRPRVFIDIESRASSGRLIFELFDDKAPKNVHRFRQLCNGELRKTSKNKHYCFQRAFLHRIVAPEFLVQGGDLSRVPIEPLEDENLNSSSLDAKGALCMANEGPNTNRSQFFVTLCAAPWLKESTTVIGRIVRGMDIIEDLQDVVVDEQDQPVEGEEVIITRCGELQLKAHGSKTANPTTKSSEGIGTEHKNVGNTEPSREGSSPKHHEESVPRPRDDGYHKSRRREEREVRTRSKSPERRPDDPNRIILKGRGAMKFRERRKEYGRLG